MAYLLVLNDRPSVSVWSEWRKGLIVLWKNKSLVISHTFGVIPLSLSDFVTRSLKVLRLSTHSISPHSSFNGVTAYVLISSTCKREWGRMCARHTYTCAVCWIPRPFLGICWSYYWIPLGVGPYEGHLLVYTGYCISCRQTLWCQFCEAFGAS